MTLRATRIALTIALVVCTLLGAGPPAAAAQPAGPPPRIGVLDLAAPGSNEANLTAFRQGLRALGYVEGQNLAIELRSAGGRAERLPDVAAELVGLKVDVIVTTGTSAALAARHVTATTPIVMASSGDPVFAGLVASLARPGGNVTGLHGLTPPLLGGQRLQILEEAIPALSRVGVLLDSGDVYARLKLSEIERVARRSAFRSTAWRPCDPRTSSGCSKRRSRTGSRRSWRSKAS